MISKNLLRTALLGLALSLVSCDKDFNEIGTNIIGEDHYGLIKSENYTIAATSTATGPVQSDGLAINAFGVYDNPVFGRTTANFVTQVELKSVNPSIDETAQIDSVVVYVPYYATLESTDTDGNHEYTLDSIFGARESKLQLKVLENKYFLRDQVVENDETSEQIYYNDMGATIESANAASPQINNATQDNHAENDSFSFSPDEYILTVEDEDDPDNPDVTRVAPGMRLHLDNDFFQTKILEAPEGMLANNNVFKNYFRGLYFKVANPTTAPGVLNMLNFAAGTVTLYYKQDVTTTVDGVSTTAPKAREMVLNLTGNSISLLSYENVPPVPANRLVVKGGQGNITTVNILTADEIQHLKDDNIMINEANLIFYVDRDAMAGAPEPNRIYLYDMKNGQPIVDYNFDGSTNGDIKFSRSIFGGILEKDDDESNPRGIRYKLRVTNYVRSLINSDSTNVTLGISVSETISETSMSKLKNPITLNGETIEELPKASVMSPFGTILYGPNIPAGDEDYDKRLKLVLYYTKPDSSE